MARPLRLEFDGALYRITSRGDHREAISELAKPSAEYLNQENDRNRAIARANQSGGYTLGYQAANFEH